MQIFSQNDDFIRNKNLNDEFEYDKEVLKQFDINSLIVCDSNYLSTEYKVYIIPAIVDLKK